MDQAVKKLFKQIKQKWIIRQMVSFALASVGTSLVITAICMVFLQIIPVVAIVLCLGLTLLGFILFLVFKKGWNPSIETIARHLNRTNSNLEESAELLIKPTDTLTLLEQFQLAKIMPHIKQAEASTVRHPFLKSSIFYFVACVALVKLVSHFQTFSFSGEKDQNLLTNYSAQDSSGVEKPEEYIKSIRIKITPPSYTSKAVFSSSSPDITVDEGSEVEWTLELLVEKSRPFLVLNERDTLYFKHQAGSYRLILKVTQPSFYTLGVAQGGKVSYVSSYHKIDVVNDQPPAIRIHKPEQYTLIGIDEPPDTELKASIEDDFGLTEAYIVATVSKGSGEAVKFREEKLALDGFKRGSKKVNVGKHLKPYKLGMEPGDELYFYIYTSDNHLPANMVTKSDVYFLVLEDTALQMETSSEGLAVDRIPEYFRSERQIIIDTEKLLKEKNKLSKTEFNNRSNSIGFDQKALRMRYGEFLGEESEGGEGMQEHHDEDNSEGKELGNKEIVEKYGHTHDHEKEGASDADPVDAKELLDKYGHSHDSAEENTFFGKSVRSLLKACLDQMWQAELYLRTNEPKQALPYERKALALLKLVQQKSRVYVKKSGFDPPPIKIAEKRLSGELKDIMQRTTSKQTDKDLSYAYLKKAYEIIEVSLANNQLPLKESKADLEKAGQELAGNLQSYPIQAVESLQYLRTLIQDAGSKSAPCRSCLVAIQKTILSILPTQSSNPSKSVRSHSKMGEIYLNSISK